MQCFPVSDFKNIRWIPGVTNMLNLAERPIAWPLLHSKLTFLLHFSSLLTAQST